MASTRQLKNKLQAVGNIQQMTRAMQMVAAAKMRKAQETALAARPYAKQSFELMMRLKRYADVREYMSPFLSSDDTGRVCLIVVASDKGLCGSYNSAVLKRAMAYKKEQEKAGKEVDIVAVGKKVSEYFEKRGGSVVEEFTKLSDVVNLNDAMPIIDWVEKANTDGQYERIMVCSTVFVSALKQEVRLQQVLPLQDDELKAIVEGIVPRTGKYSDVQEDDESEDLVYILEPSMDEILEGLLGKLVRIAIYHLVIEANASEHSARMIAMQSASDNAKDIKEGLVLALNKARQASITQELSEISTAKEALSGD